MVARRTCVFVMPDGQSMSRRTAARPVPTASLMILSAPPRRPRPVVWAVCVGARRVRSPSPTTCRASRRSRAIGVLFEIVVTDAMGLDNGIARLRVLLAAALAAAKLLETSVSSRSDWRLLRPPPARGTPDERELREIAS